MYRLDPADYGDIETRLDRDVARARRTGDHLWIATVAFRLADPTPAQLFLDQENLMTYPMVGCWVCEQPYTERMRHRRCPGVPTTPAAGR